MSNICKKEKLVLSTKEISKLKTYSQSKTLPYREVLRAQVLLNYHQGKPITEINRITGVSRRVIYEYIEKALSFGAEKALKDLYHSPKEPVITQEAKLWVIKLACTKPKEYGYAAEFWTYSLLARHTRDNAPDKGYPCLKKAAKATIYRILNESKIKTHKINYYLERRDEQFDEKMNEVLMVYQEVNLQNKVKRAHQDMEIITVSVDEKPGVQAIKNIAPDLPPKPGKQKTYSRDYEYKRLGTLSILASLDLHTGKVIAEVQDEHRSREFIMLLKKLDANYPKKSKIRIILDNHSSHVSKETRKYLENRPNRFIYVHTPKHGSWLNLVETLFGKMARTFLKGIHVESKTELKERILKGIEEINQLPVVHKWSKFDFEN